MSLEIRHVDAGPGAITGQTAAIPTSPTIITFAAGCTQVDIQNQDSSVNLYVRYNGSTCTTSDFSIKAGTGFTFDGGALNQVCLFGPGATGNYSLLAH
jgi:hypothetical protein